MKIIAVTTWNSLQTIEKRTILVKAVRAVSSIVAKKKISTLI